jgi:hypothetical protein
MRVLCLLIAIAQLSQAAAHAQGTFQNLDFEATSIPSSQPSSDYSDPSTWVTASAALPGWSAFLGTNQLPTVLYNSVTSGSASVSLMRVGDSLEPTLEETFSAVLLGGITYVPPGYFVQENASLSQTGLVPADAQSIHFKSRLMSGNTIEVSLGGQSLFLVPLRVTAAYTLYGADVSAFAGQTTELRFTSIIRDGQFNHWMLDSIQFSPQSIPEPGGAVLVGLGTAVIFWRTRRNCLP